MLAVQFALEGFREFLSRKSVLLCTGNVTVACYRIKQGGVHSATLSLRAEAVLLFSQRYQICLSARLVPGKLNVLADSFSRPHMILLTEWALSHAVRRSIFSLRFRPHIDLFASRFNHRLPTYVSPVPDPVVWAVDALSFSWEHLLGFAFPPFPILAKVIRIARLESASLFLVRCWH